VGSFGQDLNPPNEFKEVREWFKGYSLNYFDVTSPLMILNKYFSTYKLPITNFEHYIINF